MADRKQCVFQLIRYVPDPVKNEFVNIGVLLRTADDKMSQLSFTRDWARVRCLDPDADTQMLEALEIEVGHRLASQPIDHPKPILPLLERSLSNAVQITEAKAYLAESFPAGIEDLMKRYVESPKRERTQRRGGRSALVAAMRTRFEAAGVWNLMQKQVAVNAYTGTGDPLRIDCGYVNKKVKLFHAISLEASSVDAKVLAFAAPDLAAGISRVAKKELVLTAIVEPIAWPPGDNVPDEERTAVYAFASRIMEEHGIVIKTTTDLLQLAETAREDLHI
jgi:Protein of unknown function (DUF3037)